jgi:hypothetical protein
MLTFDPGVGPSFSPQMPREWPADEIPAIKPYVQVIPKTIRGLRTFSGRWQGLTRGQKDYILSFFEEMKGSGNVFAWRPPDFLEAPAHRAPDLAQVTRAGAPGASRTYSVMISWADSLTGAETLPGPAGSIVVEAGKVLQVTAPRPIPTGADRMRVYASTAAGSECRQAEVSVKAWEEPTAGLLTLTPRPASETTLRPLLIWRLQGPVTPIPTAPNRFDVELEFVEQFL